MLRSPLVRLVVFFVVLVALDFACQVGPRYLHLPFLPPPGLYALSQAIGLALAMGIAYRLLVRWTEKRKADELALRKSPVPLAAGIAIGVGLFSLVFGGLTLLGAAHLSAGGFGGIGNEAAIAISAAVGEEIVVRGTVFRLLEESFGTLASLVVSAVVFGALHAGNPGANLVSTAAIALEAGLLLAAAYAATRTLWLPIGLHFGWNFAEGGIFGAAVSGGKGDGIFSASFTGSQSLITGGPFGPEASVVAVGVCLAATAVFLAIAIARGRWVGARFRLAAA